MCACPPPNFRPIFSTTFSHQSDGKSTRRVFNLKNIALGLLFSGHLMDWGETIHMIEYKPISYLNKCKVEFCQLSHKTVPCRKDESYNLPTLFFIIVKMLPPIPSLGFFLVFMPPNQFTFFDLFFLWPNISLMTPMVTPLVPSLGVCLSRTLSDFSQSAPASAFRSLFPLSPVPAFFIVFS